VSIKTTLIKDDQGRRLVVDLVSADPSKLDLTPALNRPKSAPPKTQAPPKIVVLDPGHGGIDSGAVGFVVEKEATLDVALRVRQILQGEGIQVVMTRSADTQLSTDKRTDLGMRANMANSKRSLFVAIHVNSSPSGAAQGIETYYFGDTIDPSLRAQVIQENGGGALGQQLTREAQSVANQINSDLIGKVNLLYSRRLAASIQNSLVDSTGAINRGIHSAPFYVIRKARIPAILIEVGFTSNPSEGKKLETSNYRENIAQAIAAGILRFLNNGASASR
ncbi:MAG: N-acetylmuramoyl-L-alanine amidase, partial [Thermaceae bacterium]|nr:N-acetylmuramoyl-L-alanine amidase [Thermaceae bacterium]